MSHQSLKSGVLSSPSEPHRQRHCITNDITQYYSSTASCFTRTGLALIVLTSIEQVVYRVCHTPRWTQCSCICTHVHFAVIDHKLRHHNSLITIQSWPTETAKQARLGLSCLCQVTWTKAANWLDITQLNRYSYTHCGHPSRVETPQCLDHKLILNAQTNKA